MSLVRILFRARLSTYLTLPGFLLADQHFRTELTIYQAHLCLNHYENLGYSGSIRTVIEQSSCAQGILILPVDAPKLSHALLLIMLNLIKKSNDRPAIIVPYANLSPGHPAYFSRHFFEALIKSHHQGGPRHVIAQNKQCVHRLFWPDARILQNFNRPEDLTYGL